MFPLFDKIKKICYNIYVIKKGKSFKSMNELERIKYLTDYLNQTTKAYDELRWSIIKSLILLKKLNIIIKCCH